MRHSLPCLNLDFYYGTKPAAFYIYKVPLLWYLFASQATVQSDPALNAEESALSFYFHQFLCSKHRLYLKYQMQLHLNVKHSLNNLSKNVRRNTTTVHSMSLYLTMR